MNPLESFAMVRPDMQPCRVCNAKASGLHYGIPSCSSCKAFFHRSLKNRHLYRCRAKTPSPDLCDVIPGSKKSCQFCRLRRCLAAGMSVDAIKVGRYSVLRPTKHKEIMAEVFQGRRLDSSAEKEDISPENDEMGDERENDDTDTDDSRQDIPEPGKECDDEETVLRRLPVLKLDTGIDSNENMETDIELQSFQLKTHTGCGVTKELPGTHFPTSASPYSMLSSIEQTSSGISFPNQWANSDGNSMEYEENQEDMIDLSPSIPLSVLNGEDADARLPVSLVRTPRHVFEGSPVSEMSNLDSQLLLVPNSNALSPIRPGVDILNEQYERMLLSPSPSSSSSSSSSSSYCSHDSDWSMVPVAQSLLRNQHRIVTLNEHFKGSTISSNDISIYDERCDNVAWNAVTKDRYLVPLMNMNVEPCLPMQMPLIDSCVSSRIASLYINKDDVIQRLLKAGKDHLRYLSLVKEKAHVEKMIHLEGCHQRKRIFGSLKFISHEEYEALYNKTGIDVDGRRKLMTNHFLKTKELITDLLCFAFCIPGFSYLKPSEKIELARCCRYNLMSLTTYEYLDTDLGVFMTIEGRWACLRDVPHHLMHFAVTSFKLIDRLQKMRIYKEELIIMAAMTILSSGKRRGFDYPISDIIYKELYQLLVYACIRQKRSMDTVARYLNILDEFDACNKELADITKMDRFYKYSSLIKSPLYSTVMSDIVPEEERNSELLPKPMKLEDVLKALGFS